MDNQGNFEARVSLLTAGRDRHYSLGLASSLVSAGTSLDIIGGDDLEDPELCRSSRVNFLNLRGQQGENVSLPKKMRRVLIYYFRLLAYVTKARPKVFHILWNNKFELFDRTLLMGFYKLLGKKIAFTAHNVNAGKRDGCDTFLNRASLKLQYRLCDQIFVHTVKMKQELISEFGVSENKITLIPFGINNAVPMTSMTTVEARGKLGLGHGDKVVLFFGNIAPYKGLEFLVEAFENILKENPSARLLIAGRPKGPPSYWEEIRKNIASKPWNDHVIEQIEYIADSEIEIYFKAADVLVLPYTHIFQSGVLFLAYSFGLPVIAADVGSLKEEIVEGKTGFTFEPKNSKALAHVLQKYFQSDLYQELESRRQEIQDLAAEKYSWTKVAAITIQTYANLLREEKNDATFSLNSHSSLQR